MVATGQNPSILVSRAPTEPPPIPASKDKWVKRIISQKVVPTSTTTVLVVPSDLVGGFIDKIQVWGVDVRGITATLKQANLSDLGADDIIADDYSSYAQLPGVTFKIPVGHAIEISGATSFSVLSTETLGSTTASAIIVHYHAWIRY